MTKPISSIHSTLSSSTPGVSVAMPGSRPASLWQRMLESWIRTYELSARSGTVPFLLP